MLGKDPSNWSQPYGKAPHSDDTYLPPKHDIHPSLQRPDSNGAADANEFVDKSEGWTPSTAQHDPLPQFAFRHFLFSRTQPNERSYNGKCEPMPVRGRQSKAQSGGETETVKQAKCKDIDQLSDARSTAEVESEVAAGAVAETSQVDPRTSNRQSSRNCQQESSIVVEAEAAISPSHASKATQSDCLLIARGRVRRSNSCTKLSRSIPEDESQVPSEDSPLQARRRSSSEGLSGRRSSSGGPENGTRSARRANGRRLSTNVIGAVRRQQNDDGSPNLDSRHSSTVTSVSSTPRMYAGTSLSTSLLGVAGRRRSAPTTLGSFHRQRSPPKIEEPKRELSESFIQISVRIRPRLARERDEPRCVWGDHPAGFRGSIVQVGEPQTFGAGCKTFEFDGHIYDSAGACHSQEEVFDGIGVPMVRSIQEGFNACVFALGQTGTGKTYTILGTREEPGLLPRLLRCVFESPQRCQLSFVELYMDRLRDLLVADDGDRPPLEVRWNPQRGVYISNLSEVSVENLASAQKLVTMACRSRCQARTTMNATSSRGHAVFRLTLESGARLCVVDLAGAENEKTTRCRGKALAELGYINKSLFHLTNVIQALARRGGSHRVPYRDSKLTMILSDSLRGSRTYMVATVAPTTSSIEESLTTLRLAQSVHQIRTTCRRHYTPERKPAPEADRLEPAWSESVSEAGASLLLPSKGCPPGRRSCPPSNRRKSRRSDYETLDADQDAGSDRTPLSAAPSRSLWLSPDRSRLAGDRTPLSVAPRLEDESYIIVDEPRLVSTYSKEVCGLVTAPRLGAAFSGFCADGSDVRIPPLPAWSESDVPMVEQRTIETMGSQIQRTLSSKSGRSLSSQTTACSAVSERVLSLTRNVCLAAQGRRELEIVEAPRLGASLDDFSTILPSDRLD